MTFLTDPATLGPRLKAIRTEPFTVNASDIGAWSNLNEVECVWVAHWKDRRARLASITTNRPLAVLTFREPEGSPAGLRTMHHFPQANTFFFFENAYEFLDAAGEWYVDIANVSGGSVSDTIENNLIDGVGEVYADALPIVACNVAGIAIRHNTIRHCPYGAISVGWSWRDVDQGCHDNEIAYNRISHYLQLLDDSAGIYTLGMMKGGVVHDNYVSDLKPSPYQGGNPMAGIYQDNGSCFVTVRDNVLDQTGSAFYAFNRPNHDNTYSNNFYNVALAKRGMRTNNLVTNNVVVSGQNWPPPARRIMQAAGLEPAYADLLEERASKHQ